MKHANLQAGADTLHDLENRPRASSPEGAFALVWRAARERYADVEELRAKAGRGLTVDFVHDLRVATRRLTEVVHVLEADLRRGQARQVLDCLRDVRRAAGRLRDSDVMLEHARELRPPAAVRPLVAGLLSRLPAERPAAEAALRRAMGQSAFAEAMVILETLLAASVGGLKEPRRASIKHLDDRVTRARTEVKKAFTKATKKQTPDALHAARIAAKKLRYALELTDAHKHELKFLKGLQKNLGDVHDTEVLLEALTRASKAPADPAVEEGLRRWQEKTLFPGQAKKAAAFFGQSYLWLNGRV